MKAEARLSSLAKASGSVSKQNYSISDVVHRFAIDKCPYSWACNRDPVLKLLSRNARVQPFWRRLYMKRKLDKRKFSRPKAKLGLPDLDQSKAAVLGSLRSPESQRGYRHAIDEFIEWYCS